MKQKSCNSRIKECCPAVVRIPTNQRARNNTALLNSVQFARINVVLWVQALQDHEAVINVILVVVSLKQKSLIRNIVQMHVGLHTIAISNVHAARLIKFTLQY